MNDRYWETLSEIFEESGQSRIGKARGRREERCSSPKESKNPSAKLVISTNHSQGSNLAASFAPSTHSSPCIFLLTPISCECSTCVQCRLSIRPFIPPILSSWFVQFCGQARSGGCSTWNASIWNLFRCQKKQRIDRTIWRILYNAKIMLSQARRFDNRKKANSQLLQRNYFRMTWDQEGFLPSPTGHVRDGRKFRKLTLPKNDSRDDIQDAPRPCL